ncbi:unnamed protein product [Urochloa decumbens]|uniref:BZIP domain-containing protein n=1 Tax=Urochloa decumbens TaxID=240449 RepID=A0ABC9G9K2_9POAL
MDRDPPPRTTSSFPLIAAAGGTPPRSPMVRGATTSPMLTSLSSPASLAPAHSHRRYYSSLYPPPLPAGRLATASTTAAAGGYSYGGSSSSRFQLRRQQIPPPPPLARAEPERPGRPRTTCALPTPFFSELAEIRRVGASLFGDLDAPTRRGAAPAIYGRGHQHRDRQPWTPLPFTPPARGRSFSAFTPPPPSAGMPPPPPSRRFSAGYYSSPSPSAAPAGIFSGTPSWPLSSSTSLPPPASLSSATGMLPPPTTPRFSGAGGILSDPSPSWASQQQQAPAPASQQQQANPWSTDLSSVSGGSTSGIFTTLSSVPPASHSQQQLPVTGSSFTDLAPLPEGCGLSGFTASHTTNETTTMMLGSSSWSPADTAATAAASASDTMYYGQAQSSPSSDSELPPLPPSLQMKPEDLNQAPSFWQQPSAGNNSCYGTETAATAYTATDQSEEETRLQAPMTTHLLQVKQEPGFDATPCQLDPVYVALDGDEEEKFLSALLHSLKSPSEPASLDNQAPLSSDGWLQQGGLGDVEGSGQSWDMEALMNTPLSSLFNYKVNACSTGASGSGIPMNCDGYSMPMSQHQQQQQQIPPPQEGDQQFSMGSSADWQLSQNNLQIPLLPSSTDSLHQLMNNSSHSPSIWNTGGADGSGQGWSNTDADVSGQAWAGLPALANMFDQMNIIGQGGTTTPAAADHYGMLDFDSSGNSSGMPSFASNNFDQMNTGGGGMSIGEGFSATPAPMFHINGSSSMQLNFGSSTMESSTPEPKLMLGGMERPRMPRCTPSLTVTAGASSSGAMPRRGAYGDFFSEADMAAINKDKRLKEMVNTDPKRVKRILNNRASVAKLKAQRHAEFLDLN